MAEKDGRAGQDGGVGARGGGQLLLLMGTVVRGSGHVGRGICVAPDNPDQLATGRGVRVAGGWPQTRPGCAGGVGRPAMCAQLPQRTPVRAALV